MNMYKTTIDNFNPKKAEEKIFQINDTNRSIGKIIKDLREFESPLCDKRVKEIILINLEQAQLWSLKMIISEQI